MIMSIACIFNFQDNSQEFKDGIKRLMNLLNMPQKPDDVLTNFKALSRLITEKLNPDAIQNAINNKNPNDKVCSHYFEINFNIIDQLRFCSCS
jgi:hypothetical protein